MRWFARRLALGAAALWVGMAAVTVVGAADVSDDEFKTLVDQDAKVISKAVDAFGKAATAKDKESLSTKSRGGVRSSALTVAVVANARITGKNAAADAKNAAVRDAAIKVVKAAKDSDFKAIGEALKEMTDAKGTKGEKVDVLKAIGEISVDDVMHSFKKTVAYGTGMEDAIKENQKKLTAKPEVSMAIAHRVLALAEVSKTVMKASNAKEKMEWNEYNEKMEKAANDLLAAAKGKKTAAEMNKLYTALNGTCTACHNKFK